MSNSKIQVVPFAFEHVGDVYEINKLSLRNGWSLESFFKELHNDLARYFVVLLDDKVAGFGGMWFVADEAHITNIAVHPSYRGNGLGTILIKHMIEYCKEHSMYGITLEVRISNTGAQRLYTSLGFESAGIRKKFYQDTGEDGVIMWIQNLS